MSADTRLQENTEEAAFLKTLRIKERFHDLETAYCRGVDRRDEDLLRSIFFEDAFIRLGKMQEGRPAEWVDWIINDFGVQYENTTHYLLNEAYKVDGRQGEGETHRISYHRYVGGTRELLAASRTFNRYEERDGVWKISYREVVRDWIHERPVDTELLTGGFDMEMSSPGAGDRSYSVLQLFGRGPLESA